MKKISIIPVLCLCSGVAFGDIASTEYVNSEKGKLETEISSKADGTDYAASKAMLTSDSGAATAGQISGSMMADGAITTDKLVNGAVDNNAIADETIGLNKLSLTFPTSGKHILTWDNTTSTYKFEAIKLAGLQCPADEFDIGFDQCVSLSGGFDYGNISNDGSISLFVNDLLDIRVSKKDSLERRACQTVMYEILHNLVRILAPMICFTAEEIWEYMKHVDGENTESVMLSDYPKVNEKYDNKA